MRVRQPLPSSQLLHASQAPLDPSALSDAFQCTEFPQPDMSDVESNDQSWWSSAYHIVCRSPKASSKRAERTFTVYSRTHLVYYPAVTWTALRWRNSRDGVQNPGCSESLGCVCEDYRDLQGKGRLETLRRSGLRYWRFAGVCLCSNRCCPSIASPRHIVTLTVAVATRQHQPILQYSKHLFNYPDIIYPESIEFVLAQSKLSDRAE